MSSHPIARYIPLLIAGDERGLRDLFTGAPRVNDPRLGWVDAARFAEFVSNSHQGLAARRATVEHVTTTATGTGATEECVITLVRWGYAVDLPVAIASDTSADSLLHSVRIYHSMWPLVGSHVVRSPPRPRLPSSSGRIPGFCPPCACTTTSRVRARALESTAGRAVRPSGRGRPPVPVVRATRADASGLHLAEGARDPRAALPGAGPDEGAGALEFLVQGTDGDDRLAAPGTRPPPDLLLIHG